MREWLLFVTEQGKKNFPDCPFEPARRPGLWRATLSVAGAQLTSVKARLLQLMTAKQTCAIIPGGFEIKAVFFDMDATVIKQESIDEIAKLSTWAPQIREITDKAMRGELEFKDAFRQRLSYLKGLRLEDVEGVGSKLTLNQGMDVFADWAKLHGIKLFLVSGGFNIFAQPIAQQLGFTEHKAHELECDSKLLTGRVIGEIIGADEKRNFFQQMCSRYSLKPEQTVAVGDGANDKLLLQSSGCAIGFHPKPVLLPMLNAANFSEDHGLMCELFSKAH